MDFNPHLRDPKDFEPPYPITRSWIGDVTHRLVSILTAPSYIRGVDASHWNTINFEALKASGIDFVILKATEGNYFIDPKFDESWRLSLDNNLAVMIYHFFRGDVVGGNQSNYCIDNSQEFLTAVNNKTVIFADVETEDGVDVQTRRGRLKRFCNRTLERGIQVGNYSSPYLWSSLIGDVSWANNYWQWLAHWIRDNPTLPVGWTWEKAKWWQRGIYPRHDWIDYIGGIDGEVDETVFFGTVQELYDLLGITMDCCGELKEEIERLDALIILLQEDMIQVKGKSSANEEEITKIKSLIQSIKDIFCI